MRQGTTPTHTFKLDPGLVPLIDKVRITYSQFGEIVLQRDTSSCRIEDGQIVVRLTQEETLRFVDDHPVKVQGHILTVAGDSFVSNIIEVPCEVALDGEALV